MKKMGVEAVDRRHLGEMNGIYSEGYEIVEEAIGVPGEVRISEQAVEVEVEGVDGVAVADTDESSEEDQGEEVSNAGMDGTDLFKDGFVFDLQDKIDKPRRRKNNRR